MMFVVDRKQWIAIGVLLLIMVVIVILFIVTWTVRPAVRHQPDLITFLSRHVTAEWRMKADDRNSFFLLRQQKHHYHSHNDE